MEVRLIGPVVVASDAGDEAPIASARLRALLAALALHRGRPLTQDELVDLIWESSPPASARGTLQGYVYRLRSVAGPVVDTLETGYALSVGVTVDEQRFAALVDAASLALGTDAERAAAMAQEAVNLRRAAPMADLVDGYTFVRNAAARLEDRWIAAHELLAEARLRLGRSTQASDDLAALVDTHPYRERLWALLMRSLYAEGRAHEALAAYQRVRRILADDLGLEPSPVLVDTEQAVLSHSLDVYPAVRPSSHRQALKYVRDHAAQLVYQSVGRGSSVVLVSGTMSFLIPITARWLEALAERTTVLVFDPRGIGRSDPITGPFGLDDRLADLLAVMRAASLDRATLIAVNDGGPIALAAAALHPAVVDGIVLFNTWDRLQRFGNTQTFEQLQRHYQATWGAGCTLAMLDPMLAARPEVRMAVIEAESMIASPSQALAVNRVAESCDGRPFVSRITCPTIVLHTEANPVVPIKEAEKLARRLTAPLLRIPGASHNFVFDDPAPSVDAIADFASSSSERRRRIAQEC